jgi:RimJ/RimL family protein N-acetyltransferase
VTATFTIRRAKPGDEPVLRELRIAALTDSPSAFSSTLEREINRTAENWRSWFTPPSATFILESAQREPCGIVAGALDRSDPSIAILMSMWVHPSHRGTGAASQLIALIQQWAAESRVRELRLLVNENNPVARRCYERLGFRSTGHRGVNEFTGKSEIEMSYLVPG